MENEVAYFELNTGAKIPSIGLGTWLYGHGFIGRAVEVAIKSGYRHIDCARFYGNEKEIGLALKKLFDDGTVKREDMFITSKLWCTDHAPGDVPVALDRTLEDLQLEYIDLYLIHWPVRMRKDSVFVDPKNLVFDPENLVATDVPSTWRAMEALYDSGKARAIGVSNFSMKKLSDLLDIARIPPAVNQVECHLSWQQAKLHEFCKNKGIHLSGYSPLGSPEWLKNDYLHHPALVAIAEKLGKTVHKLHFDGDCKWDTVYFQRARMNLGSKRTSTFGVGPYLMTYFLSYPNLSRQKKLVTGSVFVHETFGEYKTIEDLWDREI